MLLGCEALSHWHESCCSCHPPMRIWSSFRVEPQNASLWQAYEGLETAKSLREEYLFIPAKVRELYLTHLLESLEDHKVR